jgi:hypothetical protein
VLPTPVQAVGLIMPLTWWLEGVRQALFAGSLSAVGGQGSVWTAWTGSVVPSNVEIVVALALTTALALGLAVACFRWAEHSAKEKGVFDMITGS